MKTLIALLVAMSTVTVSAQSVSIEKDSEHCSSRWAAGTDLIGSYTEDGYNLCASLIDLGSDVIATLVDNYNDRYMNESDYDARVTALYAFESRNTYATGLSMDRVKQWMDALGVPEAQRGEMQISYVADANIGVEDWYDWAADEDRGMLLAAKMHDLVDNKPYMRVSTNSYTPAGGCPCGTYREHEIYFLDGKVIYLKRYRHDS